MFQLTRMDCLVYSWANVSPAQSKASTSLHCVFDAFSVNLFLWCSSRHGWSAWSIYGLTFLQHNWRPLLPSTATLMLPLLICVCDVPADTGGLLGLFMGFSFLSAVEGLYFLTLRLWCSLVRNRHDLHTENPRPT